MGLAGYYRDFIPNFAAVCYASKKLSSAERNYSTNEKECLAIVLGIKRSHVYVYGVPFCAADRSRAAEVHGQRKIYQRTTHAMGDGSTKLQFQGGSLQMIRECWSGLS